MKLTQVACCRRDWVGYGGRDGRQKLFRESREKAQVFLRTYLAVKRRTDCLAAIRMIQTSIPNRYIATPDSPERRALFTPNRARIRSSNPGWQSERYRYLENVRRITITQAVVRGLLVRKIQASSLQDKLQELRDKIVPLWQSTHTSYVYRAKFYYTFKSDSYLHLAIHEQEYRAQLKIHANKSTNLQEARKRKLDDERAWMRTMMKEHLGDTVRNSLLRDMKIASTESNRKDKFFAKLWTPAVEIRLSAGATLTITHANAGPQTPANNYIYEAKRLCELRRERRIKDDLYLSVKSSLSAVKHHDIMLKRKEEKWNEERKVYKKRLMELNKQLFEMENRRSWNSASTKSPRPLPGLSRNLSGSRGLKVSRNFSLAMSNRTPSNRSTLQVPRSGTTVTAIQIEHTRGISREIRLNIPEDQDGQEELQTPLIASTPRAKTARAVMISSTDTTTTDPNLARRGSSTLVQGHTSTSEPETVALNSEPTADEELLYRVTSTRSEIIHSSTFPSQPEQKQNG